MILEELEWWEISLCYKLRDRSLFIARGGEDFGGDHLIFTKQKGGSVVTAEPKRGITENFGRMQREDHSNLLGEDIGGIAKVIKCC